jgi:ATP-dependent Clp protease protease subunit
MPYLIPKVLESTRQGEVSYDLYSRMLKDRIIFVHGGIDSDMANIVTAQLLYLEKESKSEDIKVYINSHGGEVLSGLAIHDTMKYIDCDVQTIVTGMALSMGAFLLASGTKGKRFALPNSTILVHQPIATLQSEYQATDLEIRANELNRQKKRLNKLLSEYTGQDVAKVKEDSDRDNWMSAQEALDYGIIDRVLDKKRA